MYFFNLANSIINTNIITIHHDADKVHPVFKNTVYQHKKSLPLYKNCLNYAHG
jgi:uncharacterized membrane protein